MSYQKKRKRKNRRRLNIRALVLYGVILLLLIFGVSTCGKGKKDAKSTVQATEENRYQGPRKTMEDWPDIDVQLIDINSYSRPGIRLNQVNGIVVHYTANPGSSAQANRDYFANLATTHENKVSSHFIIGIQGEIIQAVPCDEIAYASNDRNSDTLSIECCIPDESGDFTDATYDSLVELVSWLVCRYDLEIDDVIRHYDVTGKMCPKNFVENTDLWDQFKSDVESYIKKYS